MNKLFVNIISLLLLFCIGCSKNDPSQNSTRLRISLTDAPINEVKPIVISELNVNIEKIEISTVDSTDNSEIWIPLDYAGGVYNILPFSNGRTMQIHDQYFPSGVLKKIKITFGENMSIRVSGANKDLTLDPSFKDGVTTVMNVNMYAHYITNILIDINAALSVYKQNDNYFFKPNIRVFPETFGGSLKGNVLPAEALPQVFIANETDTLFTIPDSQDGMFMIKGLSEGEWEIFMLANTQSGFQDTIFTDSIYAGKTTQLRPIYLKEIQ